MSNLIKQSLFWIGKYIYKLGNHYNQNVIVDIQIHMSLENVIFSYTGYGLKPEFNFGFGCIWVYGLDNFFGFLRVSALRVKRV